MGRRSTYRDRPLAVRLANLWSIDTSDSGSDKFYLDLSNFQESDLTPRIIKSEIRPFSTALFIIEADEEPKLVRLQPF